MILRSTNLWSYAALAATVWHVSGAEAVRSAERVAVLADIHGNAVAFAAVSNEVAAEAPDLIVFGGDLTWGPLPEETWRLVGELDRKLTAPFVFVRGNADRGLVEAAARLEQGLDESLSERERWMLEQHSQAARAALASFREAAVLEIDGLGRVRFCHGSPRSDEELITSGTSEERMQALLDGVVERILVSAHTHIQFDREVAGIRSINPGSIGMPYEGEPAAFWAVLGPDVALRRTDYDVEAAAARYLSSGDPLAETIIETLLAPPTPEEVITHAEALQFSG
jgi:putative phosphoesterase